MVASSTFGAARGTVADHAISRRTMLKGGGTAVAGLTAMQVAGSARAFPGHPGDEVIPWLDQPAANRVPQIANGC
jgi:hypothetical protein